MLWNLKETLVDFVHLFGFHSDENLAKQFLKSIDSDFQILPKILPITTDNASNNNTFLKVLDNICKKKMINFDHKKKNVYCLAHIINLTVQEILKYIKTGKALEEDKILELILQEE
ncbi:zinc finger BED domain-containing protein DAYSLEEPER-like [Rhizophagus clarus]|uniref:Zinc finger BED domain-containing protein DAYSLEEPER-like n=1 Tax=Rhizophagus clarus TaxID=94130 RepID=A0A8H3L1C7_9GLOM|nr:zinc finger BED domain-containing protein DAYSLEEPER-like [Rhizophagus clarus]